MPSVVERASTGRAKCRTCGQAITRGQERFGEALPNSYGEGESLFWFHLRCAACSRPESLLSVLVPSQASVPEFETLKGLAEGGVQVPRLTRIMRAERATSGRARCRHCRELIAQGAWRLSLHLFEEGRFNSMGSLHAACAVHYFGVEPERARLELPSNQLADAELDEVVKEMREGRERPISPGLAKAGPASSEPDVSRKSS